MHRLTTTFVAFVIASGLVVTAVFWLSPRQSHAAPETAIAVTTTVDELETNGLCSLREAIQAANTDTAVDTCAAGSGSDDLISIPAGHYRLTLADPAGVVEENGNTTGDLDLLQSVSLVGAGTAVTTIDGNQIDRAFHQPFGGIYVTVTDLTVQGGNLGIGTSVNYSGGGFSLISGSALTLTNVLVTQNQASPGQPLLTSGGGGGIYNNGGQLTLLGSTILGNQAGFGAGIYNGGTLTIVDSTITENQSTYYGAGLIHAGTADVNITSSTISQNIAGSNGGGLYLTGGTTNLTNVTVSHNRASQYLGGGIWVYYEGILAVNIDHSTIYDNFAGTGGGIYNTHQQGLLMGGPALKAPQAGLITLKNSIVAANTGGNCGRSPQTSPYVSQGYNIDGADDCEFQAATDQIGTDPVLGPLQDNGGTTPTHGLKSTSPAIDAGDCTDILGNPVIEDQRGVSRPQGGLCDVGSFEFVTGQNSDLRIIKEASAATAVPLTPLVYTLTVYNEGPDLASGVTVTDTLPAGLTGVTANGADWSCQMPAGLVVCTLGPDLSVGAAPELVLHGTAPAVSGILTNTAVVQSPNFDVDRSQNQDIAVTAINSLAADLQLTKTAVPADVLVGEALTYTLAVTNAGPDAAEIITLTDTLPDGVPYLGHTAVGWTCQEASGVVTCQTAALTAGASTTITLQTLAPTTAGTITNTAVISAATADPAIGNNTAVVNTAVLPMPVPEADLQLLKTSQPLTVEAGSQITYTLALTNLGPDAAADLVLTDTLPVGVSYLDHTAAGWTCAETAGTVSCQRASLDAGAMTTVTLHTLAPAVPGTITNTAVITASTLDTWPENNVAVVETAVLSNTSPQADLGITQIVTPAVIHSGDVITLTLAVGNAGPDPAEQLVLQHILPANASLLTIDEGDWLCASEPDGVGCTLPTLAPGVTSTVQIGLQVGLLGRELRLETAVSAATADLSNSNNRSVLIMDIILPPRAYLPMVMKSGG